MNAIGIQKVRVQLGHITVPSRNIGQLICALVGSIVTQTQAEFRAQAGDVEGNHAVPFRIGFKGGSLPQNPGTGGVHQPGDGQIHLIRNLHGQIVLAIVLGLLGIPQQLRSIGVYRDGNFQNMIAAIAIV